jgi:hypothetical protein
VRSIDVVPNASALAMADGSTCGRSTMVVPNASALPMLLGSMF